jgi:ElaB/YqjD/DUF883 family membrane-anchored ribosome-binding protein
MSAEIAFGVLGRDRAQFNSMESIMLRRAKSTKTGVEAIKDDIAAIGGDVAHLGSTIGEVASDETRATIDSIRQRLDAIASHARNVTRIGVGTMQNPIAERPLSSAVAALGVGFILGVLSHRYMAGPGSR